MTNKPVLDPCCGSRKFYFDKNSSVVLFGDIRDESFVQCDDRVLNVSPDQKMDVTDLPFSDETFSLVIYDPPHLVNLGQTSYMAQAYGVLPKDDPLGLVKAGFDEC